VLPALGLGQPFPTVFGVAGRLLSTKKCDVAATELYPSFPLRLTTHGSWLSIQRDLYKNLTAVLAILAKFIDLDFMAV
jgi:hypothetical protein